MLIKLYAYERITDPNAPHDHSAFKAPPISDPSGHAANFTLHDYFVSFFIDDVPIPIKHSECVFDSVRYRCNWEAVSKFLLQHSLPEGKDVEDYCFSHLENRNRPIIVDTNMPWWLAAVIAVPLVIISIIAIKYYMKKKERKRLELQRKQAVGYMGLASSNREPAPVDDFRNI